MYSIIIGIDVSKDNFVAAKHGDKNTPSFTNNQEGFAEFYQAFQPCIANCLVVMEVTGGYEQELALYLVNQGINVHKASGLQVKNFIRSFGKHAKTDNIDALAIAHYGYERQQGLKLYEERTDIAETLYHLVMRKQDLTQILVAEKNRYQAPNNKIFKESILRHIEFVAKELSEIELKLAECINNNEVYAAKAQELESISGVGSKTAYSILALMPELGTLNGKQVASLCGLAPHPKQSGKSNGYSATVGGRRNIRPILFMAAMAAARSKSHLGDWYRGLIARGKKKMVAQVALMRKIMVIANAKLRDLLKNLEVVEPCGKCG